MLYSTRPENWSPSLIPVSEMSEMVTVPSALRESVIPLDTGLDGITPDGEGFFLTLMGSDSSLRGKGVSLRRLNSLSLLGLKSNFVY